MRMDGMSHLLVVSGAVVVGLDRWMRSMVVSFRDGRLLFTRFSFADNFFDDSNSDRFLHVADREPTERGQFGERLDAESERTEIPQET